MVAPLGNWAFREVLKMHSLSALVLLGATLVPMAHAAIGPDCVNGPLKANKICDVKASAPERAAALVAAMQTSEKLDNLMRCVLETIGRESPT